MKLLKNLKEVVAMCIEEQSLEEVNKFVVSVTLNLKLCHFYE